MRNHADAYGVAATDGALLDTSIEMNHMTAVSGAEVGVRNTASMDRRDATHYPQLAQILTALDAVNHRDQDVFTQLFAPHDRAPMKLENRGNIHNLTRARVRQIKQTACESVRPSPYLAPLVAY